MERESVAQTVENKLIPLNSWLTKNKLAVNHSKTNFILFSYRKSISIRPLKFGNSHIHQTDFTKFLGIIIDSHLKFDKHISQICNKISKTIGIIHKLNYFMPLFILKTLYSSLVLPYLTYGLEVWYSAPKYQTDRVFILQKKAVRAMNSLPFNSHTHEYFSRMQLLKLDDLYTLQVLRSLHARICDNDSIPLQRSNNLYQTRNRNLLQVPFFNKSATQKSFIYQQIIKWNHLPISFHSITNKDKFKRCVKSHILASYSSQTI